MVEVIHKENFLYQLETLYREGEIPDRTYKFIHEAIEDETFEAIDPDNPPLR